MASHVPPEVHRDRIRSLLKKLHSGEVLLPDEKEEMDAAEHDRDDDESEAHHQRQHSREVIS